MPALFTRRLRPYFLFRFVNIFQPLELGCRARLVSRLESVAIGDGGLRSCSIFCNEIHLRSKTLRMILKVI
jgi:hypothetical protein